MERILVVDDDKGILESLKDILEELGYKVTTASSGESALEKLNHQFDLALIDLKMGDVSGFDVMKAIKEEYSGTIMIVLTAFASMGSALEALRLGAYDFLQKPIDPDLLIRAIERGLEKKKLKDLSEAIIKKMEEGIVILDSEGLIESTNKCFCELLGYSSEEFLGKSFLSLVSPEDENAATDCLRHARQDESQRFQVSLITKEGREAIVITSLTSIGNNVLAVVSDITEILAPPSVPQDLIYKINPGHMYMVEEKEPKMARDAFSDLLKAGYRGTVITREHPKTIRTLWTSDVCVLWLTEKLSGDSAVFPNMNLVEEKLEHYLSSHRVVLIERLDYLILNSSFELVLKSIQRLRDLILVKKSIMLFSLDPRTVNERQLSLLQKEILPMVSSPEPRIREDLLELLEYVAKRNEVGQKPHHKEIRKRFNISRTTVRERLNVLSGRGLVVENRKGRLKVVEITERGKKLMNSYT